MPENNDYATLNDMITGLAEEVNTLRTRGNYSTTEQVVGEWIDGKPLYRKVVSAGTLPNADNKNVPHGVSNLGVVTQVYGYAVSSDGISIPIPMVYISPTYSVSIVEVTQTDITIRTGQDRSNFGNTYLVMEYTKSTD